jgi:hypothetical protein
VAHDPGRLAEQPGRSASGRCANDDPLMRSCRVVGLHQVDGIPTSPNAQDHQTTLTLGISLTHRVRQATTVKGHRHFGACTDSAFKIPDRGRLWAVSADETTLNNEIQR